MLTTRATIKERLNRYDDKDFEGDNKENVDENSDFNLKSPALWTITFHFIFSYPIRHTDIHVLTELPFVASSPLFQYDPKVLFKYK